ncbi:MAG: hypothetical protein QXQ82_00100 [Candidatus Pacearchaeota archaeon]
MKKEKKAIYKLILALLLFLILALNGCKVPLKEEPEDVRECIYDTDCTKVQLSCCPCNMGGEEQCVSIAAKPIYDKLLAECSPNVVCIQVYNCNIEKCVCKNNKCKAIRK